MGRQVLEALVQAPVLALAAGDDGRGVRAPSGVVAVLGDDVVVKGGVLVMAVPRARLEALPVVHVLVVHRTCRRGEERGDSQEDAERFVARHRSIASLAGLSLSVVQGELLSLTAARSSVDGMHGASFGPYIYMLRRCVRDAPCVHTESVRPRHPAQLGA